MFLKIKKVEKSFEATVQVKALKPISLNLDKGQHLFVIGETGSGKSTFLKCLAGQYDINGGEILLEGEKIIGPSQNLIPGHKAIRFVEQSFNLKKYNSVYQNLEMALSASMLKKEKVKKIRAMLNLFGLSRMRNKLPTELSGGQQQRLALAAAFIELPKLLILDEPFAHFDPQLKRKVYNYLYQKILHEKTTVITATHDYKETLKYADKVLILNKGRKVQEGSALQCYLKPKTIYSAGLLGEFNLIQVKKDIYLIRPEEFRISNEKEGGEVTVTQVEFCGHYTELIVIDDKGDSHLIYNHNNKNIEVGETLYISKSEIIRKVKPNEKLEYVG